MLLRFSSIVAATVALALAACGDAPPREEAEDIATPDATETPVMGPERSVLAFGNSLFAGYGLDKSDSYPAKLESSLRAKGINADVVNAGVSGDTTAAGRQRIAFTLDSLEQAPDLAIVELGGNDLLRGLDPSQTRDNLSAILDELARRDVPVLLMGMRAPPNLGQGYQQSFDAIYGELAREYDAALVPFFLEPVYDRPELIQADRVHPTAEGIEELVAATADAVADALPPAEGD